MVIQSDLHKKDLKYHKIIMTDELKTFLKRLKMFY